MNLEDPRLPSFFRLNAFGRKRREILELFSTDISEREIEERILKENLFGGFKRFKNIYETFDFEKEIRTCREQEISVLTIQDSEYPKGLRQISDPPILLYLKGALDPHDLFSIAIVGSRHPNLYGRLQAKRFAFELAEQGLSIISGMAKGIDQVSHQAALEVPYGRTLSVLGCGLDVDYPKGSQSLKDQIIRRGAILSEYPLGTPPFAENFPKRNRIIAGLAIGTLAVQAHDRSGSLITAHQAAEEGREVFAVPGSVDDLVSAGTHRLIREGAMLVTSPGDIMEVVAPLIQQQKDGVSSPPKKTHLKQEVLWPVFESNTKNEESVGGEKVELSEVGEAVVNLLTLGPASQHEIIEKIKEKAASLVSVLLDLEIRGLIKRKPDGHFELTSNEAVAKG